eukprot:scaffold136319_cov16-Tisochrysis_lutea.AAC.1
MKLVSNVEGTLSVLKGQQRVALLHFSGGSAFSMLTVCCICTGDAGLSAQGPSKAVLQSHAGCTAVLQLHLRLHLQPKQQAVLHLFWMSAGDAGLLAGAPERLTSWRSRFNPVVSIGCPRCRV